MSEKLRAIAIDAGRAALDQWNDLPLEQRRTTSLTDFQTDIVVRVCLEVAEAVRAEERQSRQALVSALRIAAELLERNGIERPEITAVLAQEDK